MIIYDIQNVTLTYPKQEKPANKNISFQIQEGEIFGLLGDNGAGKTTLVKQMMNLYRPTSGEITLKGKPVTSDPLHAPLNVGYMPQKANALNNLTVGEALYFAAHLRGLSRSDARNERDLLMEIWHIGHLRDKYSTRLSGGESRLLRLAVATAGQMPILILDEPTNDLAPHRRRLVWDVLNQLNQERGITIIFITHDAIEAERTIQRVGIMREGKLVALGKPADLKKVLDQKLRLELFFSMAQTPKLPDDLAGQEVQPGRWLGWVEQNQVNGILNQLHLDQIDDFRLVSPTLEDLYVHYAT